MKYTYSIFSLGDQAVAFEINGDAIEPGVHELLLSMKSWIERNAFDGFQDVVLGYRSIAVTFDYFQLALFCVSPNVATFVKKKLEEAYDFALRNPNASKTRHLKIPVCYHPKYALDLENICNRNNISPEDIVRLHTKSTYKVYLIGFLPGFPYLGFVDPTLEVPRHATPLAHVPAGSVGIAGKQTGIYPFDSPGGWQIIGRTPLKLFDASGTPPILFEIGDSVSFYPISEEEFNHIENSSS
jgi:inhibitor of KinA